MTGPCREKGVRGIVDMPGVQGSGELSCRSGLSATGAWREKGVLGNEVMVLSSTRRTGLDASGDRKSDWGDAGGLTDVADVREVAAARAGVNGISSSASETSESAEISDPTPPHPSLA